MGRVAANGLHLRLPVVLLSQNPHHLVAVLEPAAERVLGLKTDQEDQVPVVADLVGQMVEDPARLRHPRRGDDHRGALQRVQRLRFAHVPDIAHHGEVEQVRRGGHQPFTLIEDLGMHAEDGGRVDRERAVDIDRHIGNPPGAMQLVQAVDDLLGPAERERGDQHLAAAGRGAAHRLAQPVFRGRNGLVVAVGVGGFDDEGVDRSRRGLGVTNDRQAGAADVTGEHQTVGAALGDPEIE